jgi:preprotein translocase subunit SecD
MASRLRGFCAIIKSTDKLLSSLLALFLLLCPTLACSRLTGRFGPQDKGGTYLVITVKGDAWKLDQNIKETMSVIESRCNQLVIYCKLDRLAGEQADRFMLRISTTLEMPRVKSILLAEGMELRPVVSPTYPAPLQIYVSREEAQAAAGKEHDVLPFADEEEPGPVGFLVLERAPVVTGQHVRGANAMAYRTGTTEDFYVTFALNPEGAGRMQAWTRANINRYLGVVLNQKVRSAPYIKSEILGSGEITGRFTKQQAEDVAMILKSGNLPAPIELMQEGIYKP